MTEQELSPQERSARGKRLLFYGMFSLVVVTVVAVFTVAWLVLAPLGPSAAAAAVRITLIIGAVAIVACIIVWFIYTKAILKE